MPVTVQCTPTKAINLDDFMALLKWAGDNGPALLAMAMQILSYFKQKQEARQAQGMKAGGPGCCCDDECGVVLNDAQNHLLAALADTLHVGQCLQCDKCYPCHP